MLSASSVRSFLMTPTWESGKNATLALLCPGKSVRLPGKVESRCQMETICAFGPSSEG